MQRARLSEALDHIGVNKKAVALGCLGVLAVVLAGILRLVVVLAGSWLVIRVLM